MKNKVILVGNGINNINISYTWYHLIEDLLDYIGATGLISTDNKPFPLLYEEIIGEAVKNRQFKENDIKKFIAGKINKLDPNDFHQEILEMGIDNILTTNYDLTFEKILCSDVHNLKNQGVVKENLYNLFRHYNLNGRKIWHIHGDGNYSSSITMGYEHYSGYLQQMRNYIVTGTGNSYKNLQLNSLMKRIHREEENEIYSWLDFFFLNDIYIIGLTLDFLEIHLWWLLTYRKRTILRNKVKVNNRIIYFFPHTLANHIQHKLQLFRSYDIIPFSCNYKNEISFYKNVLSEIKRDKK